jgi:hypothetical protein
MAPLHYWNSQQKDSTHQYGTAEDCCATEQRDELASPHAEGIAGQLNAKSP